MEKQANNPLHGLTLATILEHLVNYYGWENLGTRIEIRCFNVDPSIKSSLSFLRKTPWARDRVENLYLKSLRDIKKEEKLKSSEDIVKGIS
ncbi:MAG: DUF2132 domain-containing protein [Arcicella sp.]|nr:DUF2132 domain-containing protein [Arcicella sp.]